MKPRDYCCCAIPVINAGVYLALIEQLIVGLLVGILSLASSHIVGAATPSFAPLILAIVCFVMAGLQILALIGVASEKAILFRRYLTLHSVAILAVFAVSAAWIIISATKHSDAKTRCLGDFFSTPETRSQGQTLCEVFPWVSVGVMGGLWAVLAIMHAYLFVVLSSYSSEQESDRVKFNAMQDVKNAENIPMNSRNDWDTRPSTDFPDNGYGHGRNASTASMTDVFNQPMHQPRDGLSSEYARPPPQQFSAPNSFQYPTSAYTQDPGPTPRFNDPYYPSAPGSIGLPPHAQAHPAEGSFGRKTPRYDTQY